MLPVKAETISLLDSRLPARCIEVIRRGELVIFPTETIYGIGGSAFDDRVWERLKQLKPERSKPFSYLVSGWEMAKDLAGNDIERIGKFSVSLIVQGSEKIPNRFRTQDESIGIRCPGIDLLRDLIDASASPWVHTSANLPSGKGVRKIRKLDDQVTAIVGLIIDGLTTALGGESTVIDVRTTPFTVLRTGVLPYDKVLAVQGI